jgi:hypothetical protein
MAVGRLVVWSGARRRSVTPIAEPQYVLTRIDTVDLARRQPTSKAKTEGMTPENDIMRSFRCRPRIGTPVSLAAVERGAHIDEWTRACVF